MERSSWGDLAADVLGEAKEPEKKAARQDALVCEVCERKPKDCRVVL